MNTNNYLSSFFLLLQKKRTKKKETFTRCFLGFSIERLKTHLKVLNFFQACLPAGRASKICNALLNLHWRKRFGPIHDFSLVEHFKNLKSQINNPCLAGRQAFSSNALQLLRSLLLTCSGPIQFMVLVKKNTSKFDIPYSTFEILRSTIPASPAGGSNQQS